MERISMVFVVSIGLSVVFGNLNFNNDLEYNKKFESKPTTVKACENDTVLLPCYPKECELLVYFLSCFWKLLAYFTMAG